MFSYWFPYPWPWLPMTPSHNIITAVTFWCIFSTKIIFHCRKYHIFVCKILLFEPNLNRLLSVAPHPANKLPPGGSGPGTRWWPGRAVDGTSSTWHWHGPQQQLCTTQSSVPLQCTTGRCLLYQTVMGRDRRCLKDKIMKLYSFSSYSFYFMLYIFYYKPFFYNSKTDNQ